MNTMNLDPRKNLTPEELTPPHRPLPERLRNDPVLALIREEVPKLYGDRLKRLMLYGSRARGDEHEESDYDILVLVSGEIDWTTEFDRHWPLDKRIMDEFRALASFKVMPENAFCQRTGFMWNVRQEALDI
jgi:predicted nucleotidyltransferase